MKLSDNQKYNQIITTSKKLFWKYGIKRVTIEEICREAGVSKMTFYKYLKNKNDLVKQIIEHTLDKAMVKYRKIMQQDIPFIEKARQSIALKMEQTEEMSNEFFEDYFLHADPELSDFLSQKVAESIGIIMKDYIQAQKKGEIRADIRPEFILYFLNHMTEMAKDQQLLTLYKNPGDLVRELINFFFYGIIERN
jgi:AcrR family transcriptional regulator